MAEARADASRIYQSILENIHSSIRSLGRSIHVQINHLQVRVNSNPTTNTIINNDLESNDNLSAAVDNPETNNNNSVAPSNHVTSECQANRSSEATSSRQTNQRRRRTRSSLRHSYPQGFISIRTMEKERNVLAAILSIVVIAILATALAQFKWFSVYNDLCDSPTFYTKAESSEKDITANANEIHQILQQPSAIRQESYLNVPKSHHSAHNTPPPPGGIAYGLVPSYKLGCATPQILALKRTIIGLCFLAIMCSMIQFFMDIMGAKRKWVNTMRTHAVGNIITVLLCVLIIGLCYFVSTLYERVQWHHIYRKLSQLSSGVHFKQYKPFSTGLDKNQFDFLTVHQVKFELSYYLVTLAGFLSILAAAANLFRKPRHIFIERIGHSRHRNRPSSESSLLSSDLLNTDTSGYFPFYHPNSWMFNPNWSSFYNMDTSNGTSESNGGRQASATFLPAPPPVTNCPPPPPYTP